MEILIDISEETYNEVCWRGLHLCPRDNKELVNAIKNGTPLPKGHGRLIDADVLVDGMEDDYEFCEAINATPTIIKSDKEGA